MPALRYRFIALISVVVACVAPGCDEPPPELEYEQPEPTPDPTTPFDFDRSKRGVGYFPGDADLLAPRASELTDNFSHLVLRSQLLDELTLSRGGAVPTSRFEAHVQTLADEAAALGSFDDTVVVLDLMRLSDGQAAGAPEPYLVTWDGSERPVDRYGFWREDYRAHVIDQVRTVAMEQQPSILVIGAEMERYLSMPGGDTDYANFVTLYREAYAAAKAASPNTRVGAGINWVRFQLDVVPNETLIGDEIPPGVDVGEDRLGVQIPCNSITDGGETGTLLRRACTDKAVARYIEPLLRYLDPMQPAPPEDAEPEEIVPVYQRTADLLTLAAIGSQGDFGNDPAAMDPEFFGALRPWSSDYPVAYYEVNWRVSSAVGGDTQNRWLQALLGAQTGVTVELVAWAGIKDLLMSECGKLTNDLYAPNTVCFQGMWSDSLAPKGVYDTLTTDIAGE